MNLNNESLKIFFDKGGNIYFKYFDKVYDINITSDNKIQCECCNFDLILINKKNMNFGKIKLSCDSNSLKGRIQKEILKSIDSNDNSDEEHEDTAEDRYLYENKEFTEYYDSESDDEYDEKVKFVGSDTDIDVCDFDDNIAALYDTLLYDNDNVYFKTLFVGIQPCYRLKIYKNGIITFRPLGEAEQMYKLTVDNEKLVLIG